MPEGTAQQKQDARRAWKKTPSPNPVVRAGEGLGDMAYNIYQSVADQTKRSLEGLAAVKARAKTGILRAGHAAGRALERTTVGQVLGMRRGAAQMQPAIRRITPPLYEEVGPLSEADRRFLDRRTWDIIDTRNRGEPLDIYEKDLITVHALIDALTIAERDDEGDDAERLRAAINHRIANNVRVRDEILARRRLAAETDM